MAKDFTPAQYEMVYKWAKKFVYGKVYTVKYDEYIDAGLDGLQRGLIATTRIVARR